MNTLTASEARANLYRLIDQTAESHEPIIISGKRSSAVLLSADDWSAIQETLFLLAVPGMRESIKAGWPNRLQKAQRRLSGELGACLCQTSNEGCKQSCGKRS
jgi:antitoxin YefM